MQRDSNGNNSAHRRRVVVVQPGQGEPEYRSVVPPHLSRVSWIKHEEIAARSALKDLSRDLKALKKQVNAERVHKARVTLRRWLSLWNVLRRDDWESQSYKSEIGKTFKRLQKLLGELRDLDVNIELGQRVGCGKRLLKTWVRRRDEAQDELEKFVDKKDISRLMGKVAGYLPKRSSKIATQLPAAKAQQSAFDHIELYLLQQESIVHEQADTATTPEEFHQLRLGIKRWRYLLTEFFGLTNLELVRAQQILGQMHDLDRLTPLLEESQEENALDRLKKRRKDLLEEIEVMRTKLPYGLRPEMTSFEPATGARSPR